MRAERGADSALLNLQLEDGSHGVVHVSALTHLGSRGLEWEVKVYGEAGSLAVTMDFADGWKVWRLRADKSEVEPLDVPVEMMAGVKAGSSVFEQIGQIFSTQPVGCRLFVDSIRAGRQVVPSFADGHRTQRVIEAALVSHSEGRRVSISEMCSGG